MHLRIGSVKDKKFLDTMYQTNPDIRFRYIYKKTFRCIYREFNSDGKTQEARE